MSNVPYITSLVLLALCAVVLGIKYYNYKKSFKDDQCVITGFISTYSDTILKICKSCISVMSIDTTKYTDEELIKTLTENVVGTLKDTTTDLGVNNKCLDLISTDALSTAITSFVKDHKVDICGFIFNTNSSSTDESTDASTTDATEVADSTSTEDDSTPEAEESSETETTEVEETEDAPVGEPSNSDADKTIASEAVSDTAEEKSST